MKPKVTKSPARRKTRSVLEMSAGQARAFFLKAESYCRVDLPPYFDFNPALRRISRVLGRRPLPRRQPRSIEDVNYTIYSNKDGHYAWRPFQLVHPVIYVELVNLVTAPPEWAEIKKRFAAFAQDPRIRCLSIPQESMGKQKDSGAQIRHWWQGIEQATIEMALDFTHVLHADITDCYPSIYTHSIAWALHGKEIAKLRRGDRSLIGNAIDGRVQAMQHGQTNGVPQGSVLLDLIAEMVLGYADWELSQRLEQAEITDCLILRYRDDYRVLVNDTQVGARVLKLLTEVLIGLGLKLNASKTTSARPVVGDAIKVDKLEWMRRRQGDRNLQKHLLLIHAHGTEFPNAGSLLGPLDRFYRRLSRVRTVQNPLQLISIAVDIGHGNPRCFPACAAIVSRLLSILRTKKERRDTILRIRRKLAQLPNNGHLEVWLQRISHPIDPAAEYGEKLCRLVKGEKVTLWNSSWITDHRLRRAADPSNIVNRTRLRSLRPVVRRSEFAAFAPY